jgi:hypothetical protein
LKKVLSDAIRQGLGRFKMIKKAIPFVIEAKSMEMRFGIDAVKMTELANEFEVEAFLALTKQIQKKRK